MKNCYFPDNLISWRLTASRPVLSASGRTDAEIENIQSLDVPASAARAVSLFFLFWAARHRQLELSFALVAQVFPLQHFDLCGQVNGATTAIQSLNIHTSAPVAFLFYTL